MNQFKNKLTMRRNFSVAHLEGNGGNINGDVEVEYKIAYTNKGEVNDMIMFESNNINLMKYKQYECKSRCN